MLCMHWIVFVVVVLSDKYSCTSQRVNSTSNVMIMKLFYDIGNDPKQFMTLIDLVFICQQTATLHQLIVNFFVFIRSSDVIEESINIYNITALFPLSISSFKLQTFCMTGEDKRVKVSIFSLFILSTESSILLKKVIVQIERRLVTWTSFKILP